MATNEGFIENKEIDRNNGFRAKDFGHPPTDTEPLTEICLDDLPPKKEYPCSTETANSDGEDNIDREIYPPEAPEENFEGDSIFSRRMTIAGGFLDIALFSSNCEQLKSILEIGYYHKYYELTVGLLVASMVLQVAAGFTLFMVGCVTIKNAQAKQRAEIMNHVTMGLVALITVVNIFISSFSVKGDVLQRCMRGELRKN